MDQDVKTKLAERMILVDSNFALRVPVHLRGEQDPEIRSPGLRTRRSAAIESGLRVRVGRALKWYDRGEVIQKKKGGIQKPRSEVKVLRRSIRSRHWRAH